jgi:hypothetical protein
VSPATSDQKPDSRLKDKAWRERVGFDSIMSPPELRRERNRYAVEAALEDSRRKHG